MILTGDPARCSFAPRAGGARLPIPPDVGAAVVAYLREGRPASSCRRLFLRTIAPHAGFASGCSITMIAKTALDRAGIRGYAHQGPHLFRHSLATELLLHAYLALKEAALAKLKSYSRGQPTRFRPNDRLLAFLEAL